MRTDCHDIQQSLGLLLSGELSPDESKEVEIHVAACEVCAKQLARFRRMDSLLAAAPVPTPPRDVIQLMALRARASSRRSATVRRFFAAAAVLATILIPVGTYFTFTPPAPPAQAHVAVDGFGGAFDLDF